MSRREPYLTKSRFMAGLQCDKRLWLSWHEPAPYEEPEPGSTLDIGIEIGRKAQLLFPGGILVDEPPWEHATAVVHTRELMTNPNVPAIFEAAFEHRGVRIRVDVLERLPNRAWGLREVKMDTGPKDHHLDDVGVQLFVMLGCGLDVDSAELIHVNKAYVRGEGDIDWDAFFARVDLTDEASDLLDGIAGQVEFQHGILREENCPSVRPSRHCFSPHECEFWDRCTAAKPTEWIFHMPHLRRSAFNELSDAGVEDIRDIPDEFPLSDKQALVRRVLLAGKEHVSRDLGEVVKELGPPAYYLDFETMNPAIPLYPGTSPYQMIPFQWSLHFLDGRDTLKHEGFLADGANDPRREFAETLIAALREPEIPILVYSGFERRILDDLAGKLPDVEDDLLAIMGQLRDLLTVVRSHVYHPDFGGSFSLKNVAPALVPGFGYSDLEYVVDGNAASATFALICAGKLGSDEDAQVLRRALLEYCKRDTLAMVRVHEALVRRARN